MPFPTLERAMSLLPLSMGSWPCLRCMLGLLGAVISMVTTLLFPRFLRAQRSPRTQMGHARQMPLKAETSYETRPAPTPGTPESGHLGHGLTLRWAGLASRALPQAAAALQTVARPMAGAAWHLLLLQSSPSQEQGHPPCPPHAPASTPSCSTDGPEARPSVPRVAHSSLRQ